MNENYLPLAYLNAWEYCPRRFYIEYELGEMADNEYILKGRQGRHLNDHFQLCAAALCIEERTNRTISYGEIFYYSNRRRQKVEFTHQLRQMTENAIASAQATTKGKMPSPINNTKKCQACSLKNICLPQEVRYLLKKN